MRAPGTGHRRRVGRAITTARYLASPEAGGLGQGVRFAVAGGIVTLVYLTATTVLSQVFGAPFQLALAVGFVLGLCVHFLLQRIFVWVDHTDFVLAIHVQAGRYLLLAGLQYVVTAASAAALPSVLDVSTLAVYLVTVLIVTVANFLVFRSRVFHRRSSATSSRRTARL